MEKLERLVVFLGSSQGNSPVYLEAIRALGKVLVDEGIDLIYGGGNFGLMGMLAHIVSEGGRKVLGVTPALLHREHDLKIDQRVVDHIHEREQMMFDSSDGAIIMPGGYGTNSEATQYLTWSQLGLHRKNGIHVKKPLCFLNVEDFFDNLLAYFDHQRTTGFLTPENRALALCAPTPRESIAQLRTWLRKHGGKPAQLVLPRQNGTQSAAQS